MARPAFIKRAADAVRRGLVRSGTDRLVARGLLWSRLRPDNAHYRSPTHRLARLDGIRLRLDLSDYMQWSAYFRIERDLRERLYALAPPGCIAIDIGTNIGEVLLNLARRVGPTGRAIGFEPNPATYALCVENLALNSGLPAEVHPVALGESEGELALGRPCASNSGSDRIMAGGRDSVAVPVTTLDDFATQASLEGVDLVKIDVEGFELHVLNGAREVLQRFKPVLFVELSDANLREQGASASELLRWIEDHGYTSRNAATGESVTADQTLDGCFFDIICQPRKSDPAGE